MTDHLTAGLAAYAILATCWALLMTWTVVRQHERAEALLARLRAATRDAMGVER